LGGLEQKRELDLNLVEAQETRRMLDRLTGFSLSPVLSQLLFNGLSGGRVQSAGLGLLVEREMEVLRFKQAEFWDVRSTFLVGGQEVSGRLTHLDGKEIVNGKHFTNEGALEVEIGDKYVFLGEEESLDLEQHLNDLPTSSAISSISTTDSFSHPPTPLTTSSLLALCSSQMPHLPPKEVMRAAQGLYEGGFITYHRTDSSSLSQEGFEGLCKVASNQWGEDFVNFNSRKFSGKSKDGKKKKKKGRVEEAHEAIRPAFGEDGRIISSLPTSATTHQRDLFDLIVAYSLASVMKKSEKKICRLSIDSSLESGSIARFDSE